MVTPFAPRVTGTCKCCGGTWSMTEHKHAAHVEKYGQRQYCSNKCYWDDRRIPDRPVTCKHCEKTFLRSGRKLAQYQRQHGGNDPTYCSVKCSADSRRKLVHNVGYVDKNGYLVTKEKGKLVYMHRKVMSEYLGRPLLPHENVHHLNGDRGDCRIENLQLWSKAQPSGQRVIDKIKYCMEFPKQYGIKIEVPLPPEFSVTSRRIPLVHGNFGSVFGG